MKFSKISIIGPGAIGSLFASFFSRSDAEVWLIDIQPSRVEKIRRNGLTIEGESGTSVLRPRITLDPSEVGPADLVIIAVKAYDTGAAAEEALPLLGEGTVVLTLQNGLGNVERIAEIVGRERLVGGTTAQGATVLEEGRVRHAGSGHTVLGDLVGSSNEKASALVGLLGLCDIEASITDDLDGLIWNKLIINVGINALTAITRMRNGELLAQEETRMLMAAAVAEAVAVAGAEGIGLSGGRHMDRVEEVCRATALNISSMLQDVLRRERTEIDFINGAVVSLGERLGVPTPVNQVLTHLVRTIEQSYDRAILTSP